MSIGIVYGGIPSNHPVIQRRVSNEKLRSKAKYLVVVYVLFVLLFATIPRTVLAEQKLTDLFNTTAFTGSWKAFSSLNVVGKGLNYCISIFCLLGLAGVVFRVTLTLLYKSSENLFDRVYDLKHVGKGTKFFGIPAIGKELASGNYGVGADVIVGFVLSLLPDIKSYSDYNPEKMAYNLKEDDTVTTYILKISLPTIMTIFFFSIGFSGTLWNAYAQVVDALATVADRMASVNLASSVDRLLNASSYYAFKDDGTEFGEFKYNLKKQVYNGLLRKMESLDAASMQLVGRNVEKQIDEKITADTINGKFSKVADHVKVTASNDQIKYYTSTCTINYGQVDDTISGTVVVNFPLSDLGFTSTARTGSTDEMYATIVINKKANADATKYFDVKDDGGTSKRESPTLTDKKDK